MTSTFLQRLGSLVATGALCTLVLACAPDVVEASDDTTSDGAFDTAAPTTPLDDRADEAAVDTIVDAPDPGCLELDVTQMDFGQVPVGDIAVSTVTMTNCGEEDVFVNRLAFAGSQVYFTLDCSLLAAGSCPDDASPLELPPLASAKVRVHFEPKATSDPKDYDVASTHLVVESDADTPEILVSLQGAAVGSDCPVAIIDVAEGTRVDPVTTLHLSAADSYSPHGAITSYWWSVQAPSGPPRIFSPSPSEPEVTLEADLAGTYTIKLGIWDEAGHSSCMDAAVEIEAFPETGIHVELTWETIGDDDETDTGKGNGTDLDLHLAHPLAEGSDVDGDGVGDGWFDVPWDCFWFNPNPAWGPEGSDFDDDPVLLRDDMDGGGPEVVRVAEPQDGVVYRIGVHHWRSYDFGPAEARLKVWIEGELASEIGGISLLDRDLWKAADIHWPSGEVVVQKNGGALEVTSDYPVPDGFEGADE